MARFARLFGSISRAVKIMSFTRLSSSAAIARNLYRQAMPGPGWECRAAFGADAKTQQPQSILRPAHPESRSMERDLQSGEYALNPRFVFQRARRWKILNWDVVPAANAFFSAREEENFYRRIVFSLRAISASRSPSECNALRACGRLKVMPDAVTDHIKIAAATCSFD
jgi:hypothetical protein